MGDPAESVEAVKNKAAAFDKARLLAYADQYKTVILEKKDQIATLTNTIKGLSMTEALSEKWGGT